MTKFRFGRRSLKFLKTVDHRLQAVSVRALELTPTDFGITSGLRTRVQQFYLWRSGSSNANGWPWKEAFRMEGETYLGTGVSRHQPPGPDLLAQAIDICVFPGGELSWKGEDFLPVLRAFALAGRELGVPLRSGAAWTSELTDSETVDDIKASIDAYARAKRARGEEPFLDYVHIEIPKGL